MLDVDPRRLSKSANVPSSSLHSFTTSQTSCPTDRASDASSSFKLKRLVGPDSYDRGITLLEAGVAMLTKLV
jgi:hypothetical protein